MAFAGRAIYDTDVWASVAEDVSAFISMISPVESPLLDALGDAMFPATNTLHEWLEEELTPDTIVSSATVSNTITYLPVHSGGVGVGKFLMVGTILKENTTGEYLQVTAVGVNTITVTRGFASTTAATITAADNLTVIAPSALEGADVTVDVSRPRSRLSNYCQLFKKDIIVSGTVQAVSNIGVANEFEHQKQNRMRELVNDLEKAVILGKLSGNTLGSSTAYRTMKGLWDFVTTNATSLGTLTTSALDDAIQAAWGNGAKDLDLLCCDAAFKRIVDGWNSSRVNVENRPDGYVNRVTEYTSTFGTLPVIMSRWMPTNTCLVLSTQRVKVVPLSGRSFQFKGVSPTGDAEKGMVLGEYTLQVMNEKGLAKIY